MRTPKWRAREQEEQDLVYLSLRKESQAVEALADVLRELYTSLDASEQELVEDTFADLELEL